MTTREFEGWRVYHAVKAQYRELARIKSRG